MTRVRQFLALAGLAAVEATRQPIVLLLTVTGVLATALTPLLLLHNFGEDGKLARDGGLAFHFVFGLFIAAYAACSSLARERHAGTAAAVLSKPVGRDLFFLAKFAGVAVVVLIFSLCATLATLLAERVAEHFVVEAGSAAYLTDWQTGRLLAGAPFLACLLAAIVNYVTRRPFQSTAYALLLLSLLAALALAGLFDRAGHWAPFDCRVAWRLLPVSLLVALALLVFAAFAVSLATRLDTVPTLTACSALLLLGLLADTLAHRAGALPRIVRGLAAAIPNWQNFWLADALNHDGVLPWPYVAGAAGYAAVYAAGILLLGLISFRHTEVK